MPPFIRVFEDPKLGQVAAMLYLEGFEESDEPAVVWYSRPPGLGVCAFAIRFEDSDKGAKDAQHNFDTNLEKLLPGVVKMFTEAIPEEGEVLDALEQPPRD